MASDDYHEDRLGQHMLHPETLMLGYGFNPALSEGAVKPPVFLTSTFAFTSAEHGKEFFDYVAGRRELPKGGSAGLVYSRFNHPNSEIVEDRLAVLEGAEAATVFGSGMAAIATSILAYVKPGDVILHSQPLYGGTETLISRTLVNLGIQSVGFEDGTSYDAMSHAATEARGRGRVALIVIETPSNPTNSVVDVALARRIADELGERQESRPLVLCDNTLLGPLYQHPLKFGADLSLYSLTKYVGGHSDLVAGAAVGSAAAVRPVRLLRSAIGTQLDPHSCWMLGRSLETLTLRMAAAERNGAQVAAFLQKHPRVTAVHHLDLVPEDSPMARTHRRQAQASGSTFSFELSGGEPAAFAVLNRLKIFKLAVSLGGTESLASHPASTTHSGIPQEVRQRLGITDGFIRLSIGIEHPDDLIADLEQALSAV